jgi:hypothetical protein
MITEHTRNMVLAWPQEQKLAALKELQEKGEFNMLVELMNVYLTAPQSKGGLSSKLLEETLEL